MHVNDFGLTLLSSAKRLVGGSKPIDSWKSTLALELVGLVTFIVLKDTLSDITVSYGRIRIKRIRSKIIIFRLEVILQVD